MINVHGKVARQYRSTAENKITEQVNDIQFNQCPAPTRHPKKTSVECEYMDAKRRKYYNGILSQLCLLGTFAKKHYIMHRASNDMLQIIRECIVNVHAGNVERVVNDEENARDPRSIKRLLSAKLGARELRFLLSQNDMLKHLSNIIPCVMDLQ